MELDIATALREYGEEIYSKANGSTFLCPDCEAPLKSVKRMDGEFYWVHPIYECPKVIQEKLNKADAEGYRRGAEEFAIGLRAILFAIHCHGKRLTKDFSPGELEAWNRYIGEGESVLKKLQRGGDCGKS